MNLYYSLHETSSKDAKLLLSTRFYNSYASRQGYGEGVLFMIGIIIIMIVLLSPLILGRMMVFRETKAKQFDVLSNS